MILKVFLWLLITSTVEECTSGENGCIFCAGDACSACDENYGWHRSGDICCSTNADQFPDGSGGCQTCEESVGGCQTCSYDSQVEDILCDICDDGRNLFLKGDGTCGSCTDVIPNCGACAWFTDHTQCLFCEGNYQLSGSEKCCDVDSLLYPDYKGRCDSCQNVVHGCTTCQMNGGTVYCTACNEGNGFQLSGQVCCDTKVGENPDGSGGCTDNFCSDGCTICIDNSGTYQCEVCDTDDGYFISVTICCKSGDDQFPDGIGGCESCGNLFEGCNSCLVRNGVTGCTRCISEEGYQLSGTMCCDTSVNSFPDQNGGCTEPQLVCPPGCKTCQDNGVDCLSCNPGYELFTTICCYTQNNMYPQNQKCESCDSIVSGCSTCLVIEGVTGCSACSTNYYLSGTTCCHITNDQYPFDEGSCAPCATVIQGCTSCAVNHGKTQCEECGTSGYELSATTCCNTVNDQYPNKKNGCNSCATVITGCTSCSVRNGETQCEECGLQGYEISGTLCCHTSAGFPPDGNGGCDGCSTGCLACSSRQICTICNSADGYELSGGECCGTGSDQYPNNQDSGCDSCQNVIVGCQTCTLNGGTTICQTCAANYQQSIHICCHTNGGFTPDGSGGCSDGCSAGCHTCIFIEGNSQCTACKSEEGYYLSGTICCNAGEGSFPDIQNAGCIACSTLKSNCIECSYDESILAVTCIDCNDGEGYYVTDDGNCDTCDRVLPGCSVCQEFGPQTQCSSCESAYQITKDKGECCHLQSDRYPVQIQCWSCQTAVHGCSSCSMSGESVQCTQCQTDIGYQLTGTTCCDTNVATVNGDECNNINDCNYGCTSCENEVCSECDNTHGYEISGAKCCSTKINLFPDGNDDCKPCFILHPHCTSCKFVSVTLCQECESGYSVDVDGECSIPGECPAGCSACQGDSCTACHTGFTLYGTLCCNSNNYYPDTDGTCVSCSTIQTGCTTCSYQQQTSTTSCTECDAGAMYYISGSQCCHSNSDKFPNPSGGCESCSTLKADCLSCEYDSNNSQVDCILCDTSNQKFLNKGSCLACQEVISGCKPEACIDFGHPQCIHCQSGYQLDVSKTYCCSNAAGEYPAQQSGCIGCENKIPGCNQCETSGISTNCVECKIDEGFLLSGVICCDTNDLKYPNKNECVSCSEVISGCEVCNVQGEVISCGSCKVDDNYVPNGSGACDSCGEVIEGCITCTINQGNEAKCTQCDTSNAYHLSGGKCCLITSNLYPDNVNDCAKCNVVIAGCSECEYDSVNSLTKCKDCDEDNQEFPNGIGGCAACSTLIHSCSTCSYTSQLTCDSCVTGYALSPPAACCQTSTPQYPNGQGGCASTCADAVEGCTTCQINGDNDGTDCTQCDTAAGYQLSGVLCCNTLAGSNPDGNGGCTGCPTGCLVCANTRCSQCNQDEGYYLAGDTCCDSNNKQFPNEANDGCDSCYSRINGCLLCAISSSKVITCEICTNRADFYSDGHGGCQRCGEIIEGCEGCTMRQPAQCKTCAEGYEASGTICCNSAANSYPDGQGGCQTCNQVIPGCSTCTQAASTFTCNECSDGYAISGDKCCDTSTQFPDGSGQCEPCADLFVGCQSCSVNPQSGSTQCDACNTKQSYYLSGTQCCNTGAQSYPHDGSCDTCQNIIQGCTSCKVDAASTTLCTQCDTQNGYRGYDIGKVCCNIKDNEFPDYSGGCGACNQVFKNCPHESCIYSDPNTLCNDCGGIIKNCQQCRDVSTCLICHAGHHLNRGSCTACSQYISNCEECSNSNTCTTCQAYYALISPTDCHLCAHDEVVNSAGDKCVLCSTIHPLCTACSDENTCTACGMGAQVKPDNSGCYNCQLIDDECMACSSQSVCTGCLSDFSLMNNACEPTSAGTKGITYVGGKKQDCLPGCMSCSDMNICDMCGDGFALQGSSCITCDSSCRTCVGSATTCVACYSGSYLKDSQCKACPSNCLACDGSSCSACSEGFYAEGNQCISCGLCCGKCLSASECQKCDVGFTSSNGQCKRCMTGCTSCDSNSINLCKECGIGYYRNAEDTCQRCAENCFSCSDASTCQICQGGYILNEDATCQRACIYPCDTCSAGSPTECLTCMAGHTLRSSICIPESCGSSCTSCPRTKFLSGGTCQPCQQNCDFCEDTTTCSQCSPGFFVQSGSCTVCPQQCSSCTSDKNCESCKEGYYSELDEGGMNTGSCKACSTESHCQQCQGTASQCTVCMDGYEFLQEVVCVRRTRIKFRYRLNVSLSSFLAKVYDFKLMFMEALDNSDYSSSTERLHITGLADGSTVVDAQIDVVPASAKAIYEKIQTLNEQNSISPNFPILDLANQEAVGWTYTRVDTTPIDETFPWYGIVLLIILPLLVLVLIFKTSFFEKQPHDSSGDPHQILSAQPITTSITANPISASQNF